MTGERQAVAQRLTERTPSISGTELAGTLVPPRQFDTASFENYRPDRDYPSQGEALAKIRHFAEGWKPAKAGGFFGRGKKTPVAKPGIYLDGGFGVGKTHLLAALWHAAPGPKYFGTFIEYTALIGALGYANAVQLFAGAKFIAIDEFELDDPGDTMLMTRFLGELVAKGTRLAATSNTPPNALGEGRFAASDFLREIQAIADRFDIIRIDGLDYRRRDIEGHAAAFETTDELDAAIDAHLGAGERLSSDSFLDLVRHLGGIHPSRYIKLIDGVDTIALSDVTPLTDQTDALRLVAFIDRVYDAQIRILASGIPLDQVFAGDMLNGGYRKKYLRAASRMIASATR
jgi:cell division protein ZapE